MPVSNLIIFRSKLFFTILILVIFLAGGALTAFVYSFVNQSDLTSISRGAETIASSIDISEITNLKGSEEDLTNPAYISLKAKLIKIRAVDTNVRFVYLNGRKADGSFFFYGDSEDPSSPDYSPPGQDYPEADQSFVDAFETQKPNITGPSSDRWGTWYTALAPIIDPNTHKVIATVGMDVEATHHKTYVFWNTLIPALVTLLLLAMAIIGQRISKHEQQMVELKSEFVSIASHELRSPLNGITWALDNISKAPNLTAPQTNMITEIKTTAGNLMGNINDILNASAITGEKQTKLLLEQVDVADLLKIVADQQLLTAKEKGIKISMEKIPVGSHIIKADREKLKRVFNNILSNSIKYSNSDSSIEMSFEQTKDMYVLHFTDHGIGIPAADQKKIFDGYYRSPNAVQSGATGTGLGLYFAKKIVELHGGKVWVKSDENKGTTVFVQLPITKA
ncbi:MAG TPA: HAMP domain-containing sensor histidine kinase [Patescibacteria group bacterium]|jgi:signal transduction histidine kinase|nr:HAMP domain-containing sensor histidine kinase [Patescibacteria group bacterium]